MGTGLPGAPGFVVGSAALALASPVMMKQVGVLVCPEAYRHVLAVKACAPPGACGLTAVREP